MRETVRPRRQVKAPSGQEWLQRLADSRSRIRVRMLMTALLRSLTMAAGTFLALEALRRTYLLLTGTAPLTEFEASSIAAGALLAALICNLLVSMRRFPSMLDVAILADARYGLKEQLSSAYEVHTRSARSSLEKALLHHAEGAASGVEPSELEPIRLPRAAWSALALLAAVLILQGSPSPSGVEHVAVRGKPVESVESLSQTGATVRRVSDLVSREADVRSDPYLEAVSRSLASLGERIERGELERAQVDDELEKLLRHLSSALGTDEFAPSNDLSSNARTRSRGGEDASGMQSAEADSELPAGNNDLASPGETGEEPGRSPAPFGDERTDAVGSNQNDLNELLRRLEARLEQAEAERFSAVMTSSLDEISADTFYGQVDPEALRKDRQASLQQAQGQGEVPVGAANRSNEGEGDLAGKGTQELERGAVDGFGMEEFDVGIDPLALTGAERESGKRIRLDLPPEAEFRTVDSAPESDIGTWKSGISAAGSGYLVGMMYRDVVSRYFLPAQSQGESTER